MASKPPGWTRMKCGHVSIKNQLKNGLQRSRLDSMKFDYFELRINWRAASRAPGWIHMKFYHFQIKKQLKNSLKSNKLDSHEIWSFFNQASLIEWTQELQAGFLQNFIIFVQLRINWRMASRARPDIYNIWLSVNEESIEEWPPENR